MFSSLIGKAQNEVNYAEPKEFVIAGISVSGIESLNKNALIEIAGLTVGQKINIPGDEITMAVKNLWKQKMFSDVNISIEKTDMEKVWLNIYLQERPRLSEINFLGVKKSDVDDLKEKVNLVRGTQITDNIITNSKNIIQKYYAEKGFSKAKIDIVKKPDTTLQNAVVLNVNINKYKKTRIKYIKIEGNKYFTERKIKWKKLKDTKEKRWYGLFKPSKFIETKYLADKKNLILEYNKAGFRDAKIVRDSVFNYNEDKIAIYIKVDEGQQYFFRNIKWVGNTIYETDILNKMLGIKKGDVYNKENLQNRLTVDEDAVGNLYMDNGYLFFNVNPVEIRVAGDSIDIELRIYEGEKARINKIIISGNDRTNDAVIRRELRTIPGDLFSKTNIVRSVRELANLGHFDPEKIVPTPIPDQENGTVDIEYSLVERGNDRVEISGGWGQNMLVGTVGLVFNNFSIQNIGQKEAWQPLPTGDGQQLSLRAQTNGTQYQSYSVSFEEPWLGGKKPNSLSVSAYYNLQSNGYAKSSTLRADMKILGAAVGMGRRLKWPDDYFTLYNEIGFQKYFLNKWTVFKGLSTGEFNNITFKTTWGRNSIDNPLYSRHGSSFALGLELTPPYSLFKTTNYYKETDEQKFKWLEYHKWTFKASWFTQLIGDLVLNVKGEYGYLGFYKKGYGYSPFGGFSVGGDGMGYYTYGTDIVGLRGYENGSLTPADGGNIYEKMTFEIRYPVVLNETATIYALVFSEAGNCWHSAAQLNPFDIYRSSGAGVRIFLPMLGLIGFDWGYGFDKLPGATTVSGSKFHFVLGQQF
jgi:outer membrane protein insertion porin family